MTETHTHDWRALTGWTGRYHCSGCGAFGYKRKVVFAANEMGKPIPKSAATEIIPYMCRECGQPAVAKDIVPPGAAAGIHVALTATEPVWISTKSDGKPVYSGTLQTQETRYFDGTNEMMVIIGNAGGVQATLNGKPVGPIGAHGEIRLLELTPAGARIAPRAKPTAPFALDGSVVRNVEDER
jgi:hypothetical protein